MGGVETEWKCSIYCSESNTFFQRLRRFITLMQNLENPVLQKKHSSSLILQYCGHRRDKYFRKNV